MTTSLEHSFTSDLEKESPVPSPTAEAVLSVFPSANPMGNDVWHIEHPSEPTVAIQKITTALPEDKEVVLIGMDRGITEIRIHPRTKVNQGVTKPLFWGIATLSSVIVMMAWGGPQSLWEWEWLYALPGALGIFAILFAHEWGHHLAMRRLGIKATYPYLIPFPIWWGGTFGGFVISETPPNRRASLQLAAGGPILGFLVALPIAIVGLWLSERGELPYQTVIFENGGLLWNALVAWLVPSGEGYLKLHPLAAAGYFGIFLTGANLLPVFPLDGGRWLFPLIPPFLRRLVAALMAVGLLLLTIVAGGASGFLIGLAFGAIRHVNKGIAADDVTPLSWRESCLGILLWLALFIILWDLNPIERVPFQFP